MQNLASGTLHTAGKDTLCEEEKSEYVLTVRVLLPSLSTTTTTY